MLRTGVEFKIIATVEIFLKELMQVIKEKVIYSEISRYIKTG